MCSKKQICATLVTSLEGLTDPLFSILLLQPCCHFARHSCIKGDDCPYDHQLSKYPCDKFVKGFCSRGDDCMFSHKVPSSPLLCLLRSFNIFEIE